MTREKNRDLWARLMETGDHKVAHDVWARMDPHERVVELTGHTLDVCRDILDLPLALAVQSPTVMSGKVQIVRAILNAVTRMGLESQRLTAMQEEVLEKLIDSFDQEKLVRAGSGNGRDGGPLRVDDFA